jgi:hypothetical protein
MERLEESSDASILTEHDLDSMNTSFADNGMELSKSTVLGPFNSLDNSSCSILQKLDEECGLGKKIKFKSKLREVDRKYERDNNSKVDNGMYVKNALKSSGTIDKLARRKCKPQKSTIGNSFNIQ